MSVAVENESSRVRYTKETKEIRLLFSLIEQMSAASLEIRLLSTLSDFLQKFLEFLRHVQLVFHIQGNCNTREWVS